MVKQEVENRRQDSKTMNVPNDPDVEQYKVS